ncbi:unnamed protein product [Somion occarium]|uniref:GH16 domain-containing protein n=1 Tax=Somion occarium TaxID=3059160 RepID=A0ABP1E3V6_9APHY
MITTQSFSAALLLSLPLTALAGLPHQGSLRRYHYDHAKKAALSRRNGPTFKLVDDYNNQTFFDMFDFFTDKDPTNGMVTFVGKEEAQKSGLGFVQDDGTIVLGVDDQTVLQPGQFRKSLHINSKKKYDAGNLFIADFWSMPHGCGTWPAYWTVGDQWPQNGEIDIIEGVNENTSNQITAHTGSSCVLPNTLAKTVGRVVGNQCQTINGDNRGCAFVTDDSITYGHGFNMQGGGVYAHIWTTDAIKVWFFPRGQIPQDIADGNPNPDGWPTPAAIFPGGDQCDLAQGFKQHNIVFDITLCGDWAGPAYAASGCPGTCAQAVADPSNFKVAKFKIASLKVYKQQ